MHEQPGLRKRIELEARRISAQHRQLDALYAALVDALQSGAQEQAREDFLRLREALLAHFEVEERTEFPALHGLDPGTEPELDTLIDQHETFRSELRALADCFAAGDVDQAARRLDGLGDRLGEHERNEERLFQRSTAGASRGRSD